VLDIEYITIKLIIVSVRVLLVTFVIRFDVIIIRHL